MLLSRGTLNPKPNSDVKKKDHDFEYCLTNRDYIGAITILLFKKPSNVEQWIAYSHFHAGNYEKATEIYKEIANGSEIYLNLACCYFYLGFYEESQKWTEKADHSPLKVRLQIHLSHKIDDEDKLRTFHEMLEDIPEDQLCLASIHYLRAHYQEAIEIYKKILADHRDYTALNVYVALCYYKLDYYEVAQDVLNVYLEQQPDSTIGLNLKACITYKLYTNGKLAEGCLKPLLDNAINFGNDLIRHNMVVFRGGEGALQVLPPLLHVLPEAKLNLAIFYLQQDEAQEAYELIKDLDPTIPQEYILKGVVHASMGQTSSSRPASGVSSREHLRAAQECFKLVGSSASECDTIPGRQCMASYHFLLHQFDQVLMYMKSFKTYFENDDAFNFNLGQTQVSMGEYSEAEDTLLLVQSEKIKQDITYISHLARCYIQNKKPQKAWELYQHLDTSTESFELLQLLANDCYKSGAFYHAAKAFELLESMDQSPEYWEGKRGACCGIFQMIIAKKQPTESLPEVINILRNSANNQAEQIIKVIKNWAKENRVSI